ncbi:hypothetical protein U0070_004860 [Myodes glareolus]|uniref:Uncharacterized protein n=1 Tax=Myodes glareolus TaxID=447135 RepID=A0AAW0J5Q5_MYOGA
MEKLSLREVQRLPRSQTTIQLSLETLQGMCHKSMTSSEDATVCVKSGCQIAHSMVEKPKCKEVELSPNANSQGNLVSVVQTQLILDLVRQGAMSLTTQANNTDICTSLQ